ncbi:alpha-amylase family glycosyl hydrolase [Ideonella sp. DXS22W]|uniref:Alpha-amylase family glycosyl hydrolase n=1 Tax=Pseudaquabacterium inlustre TaxID=2984192 RepID=A0ABU9CGZ1_9BURK
MNTDDRRRFANAHDLALAGVFEAREADWRNGAVVYQVLVDRFAPSANLEAKRHLYPAPKQLRGWDELPRQGQYLDSERLWSHEIDFWGGDLASLATRLDHVQQLGADVLYLNPICLAYTNHKYDALDYHQVSPEYGTREDVKALATALHARGMKLVLDGVFNHMGRNAPVFQQAQAEFEAERAGRRAAPSPERTPAGGGGGAAGGTSYLDWFVFGDEFPGGARCWWRAENLPELNLENPAVRNHLWNDEGSVVRRWLRDGVDGWRLDVAFDIGMAYLDELTRAAHAEKPGSLVVGEIANYPSEWFPAVDAVMHFTLRHLILKLADGALPPSTVMAMLQRMLADSDYEHLLKSWIYLDNHDTARLAHMLPDPRARRLAQVLQFTLPGAPNLYYGSEIDLPGGGDPEMRAPMRWDIVAAGHPALDWTKRLVDMKHRLRALRVGNFRPIVSQQLLAFERHTDRAEDMVLVLANPSGQDVTETVLVPDAKLMDSTRFIDQTGQHDERTQGEIRAWAALLKVTVPARTALVLTPDTRPPGGYSNYKRVQ